MELSPREKILENLSQLEYSIKFLQGKVQQPELEEFTEVNRLIERIRLLSKGVPDSTPKEMSREEDAAVARFYDKLSLDHRDSRNFFLEMADRLYRLGELTIDCTRGTVSLR